MNETERRRLEALWAEEEAVAHIHGWDFSHISHRHREEETLPWDYEGIVREHLAPECRLLDTDTGGGEFLLSLGHSHENTAATEGYGPNVALCREVLSPLGIDLREAADPANLPFPDGEFDLVINRHGDWNARELFRILRPGGLFITQQVGAENDRELVELLLPGTPPPFPGQYAALAAKAFERAGFRVLRREEAFSSIRFFDVGALVWFARIIPWEFPGFSVAACLPRLWKAQEMVEKTGQVEGRAHRFLLVAQKPK